MAIRLAVRHTCAVFCFQNYTQYIPLSIYDLQTWMGSPSIFVYDCSNAGLIVKSFRQFALQREQELEVRPRAGAGLRVGAGLDLGCVREAGLGGNLQQQETMLRDSPVGHNNTTPSSFMFCAGRGHQPQPPSGPDAPAPVHEELHPAGGLRGQRAPAHDP